MTPDPSPALARQLVVLAVVAVGLVLGAAGAWCETWTRGLVERSSIPARWRLPLLAGLLLGAALVGGLAWRWAVGQ